MIAQSEIKTIKLFSELMADVIPGGVLFLYIEGDTITWKKASSVFDMDIFQVGSKVGQSSIAQQAIQQKKILNQKVPRHMYGKRLFTVAIPVLDESGNANGCYSIVFPKLHTVAAGFSSFAPLLSEMFPEGAFLYMTDLQKVFSRQTSEKFDVSFWEVGYELQSTDIAFQVIQSKRSIIKELDATRFGVPVTVATFPLFDEEDKNEIVATLGIITPKHTASILREMSQNLESGLSGITLAIEQLTVSATQIHTNEQTLNHDIKEVIVISDEINKVSSFIKEIADETNMLGLNAAIEAARAGEMGRGFSVVAEEIRKLSEQSKGTVPQIIGLTNTIKQKVETVSKNSSDSLNSTQEQAAAAEEINASIEEISSLSEELSRIAQSL